MVDGWGDVAPIWLQRQLDAHGGADDRRLFQIL